jgi:hypothetical protein
VSPKTKKSNHIHKTSLKTKITDPNNNLNNAQNKTLAGLLGKQQKCLNIYFSIFCLSLSCCCCTKVNSKTFIKSLKDN